MSPCSREMISRGVLADASIPHQVSAATPDTPRSPTVGVSGSAAYRLADVTASGRSAPADICGENSATDAMATGTCPAMASVVSGPPPLYGICVKLTLSSFHANHALIAQKTT